MSDDKYSEFSDPRLVEVYDSFNSMDDDTKSFYLGVADQTPNSTIVDLGCGTGLLTCELAKHGHTVIGIEPAGAMLEVARHRPFGDKVTWIEGDSKRLSESQADLVLMTSHVAQFLLEENDWNETLKAIYKALQPNGRIAFESRNPLTEPWLSWKKETSLQTVETSNGRVEMWYEFKNNKDNRVNYEIHYHFDKSGEQLVSVNELIYRTQSEIEESLLDVGFKVENVYGDWDSSPATDESREMIFVARRG